MGKKWSPEAIQRNRRKRKAARAFKKSPLTAWLDMQHLYEGDYETFWRDANRQIRARKKGPKTFEKQRWGRELREILENRIKAGIPIKYSEIERAKRMLSPGDYQIGILLGDSYVSFTLSKKLSKTKIQEFMGNVSQFNTKKQINDYIDKFFQETRIL